MLCRVLQHLKFKKEILGLQLIKISIDLNDLNEQLNQWYQIWNNYVSFKVWELLLACFLFYMKYGINSLLDYNKFEAWFTRLEWAQKQLLKACYLSNYSTSIVKHELSYVTSQILTLVFMLYRILMKIFLIVE